MARNGIVLAGERFTPDTFPVAIRATYDCVLWTDDDPDPAQWGGYCDPSNPWGTADDDPPTDDDPADYGRGEPIELELPAADAVAFLADFPGAIWHAVNDCDASQDYRTGVYTRVCAHVGHHADGPTARWITDRVLTGTLAAMSARDNYLRRMIAARGY